MGIGPFFNFLAGIRDFTRRELERSRLLGEVAANEHKLQVFLDTIPGTTVTSLVSDYSIQFIKVVR